MNALTRYERLDDMFPEMFRRFMRPMTTAGFEAPPRDSCRSHRERQGIRGARRGAWREEGRHHGHDRPQLCLHHRRNQARAGREDRQGGRTLVSELYYGSASRGLRLGQEVQESASSAKFENGVLTLLLPKKREASSRTLKIQSSASAV